MQKRAGLLIAFFLFFLFISILCFLFRSQISPLMTGVLETITTPAQRSLYSAFGGLFTHQGEKITHLESENRELTKKIIDQQALIKEAKALRDQYDRETIPAKNLLPAKIIGMKSFIPGVSLPEELILDSGERQHVRVGQTVVLGDAIVGNITAASANRSLVSLISNRSQSITAKTVQTGAIGIVRGKGNGTVALENVVLSDTLTKGDVVTTKGDASLESGGYPPDLIIGKVTSVDKKASDLFQSAEVESPVDFIHVSSVFIIVTE